MAERKTFYPIDSTARRRLLGARKETLENRIRMGLNSNTIPLTDARYVILQRDNGRTLSALNDRDWKAGFLRKSRTAPNEFFHVREAASLLCARPPAKEIKLLGRARG